MEVFGRKERRWRSPKEKEERSDKQTLRDKFFYFRLLVFIVFGVLTLQLMRMQVFEGEAYEQRAQTNHLRYSPTMPSRGLIFDRNGTPLVENVPRFSAGIIPADFPKDREAELLPVLESLLKVPGAEIAKKVDEKRDSKDPFTPVIIKEGLTPEEGFSVREMESRLPGVEVIVDPIRHYVDGSLLAHILGYVGQVTESQYPDLKTKGYEMDDRVGQMGVESVYESVLRGNPGRKDVEVDAAGREVQTVAEVPAKPGSGLVLSIDMDLQRKTTELVQQGMGSSKNACAIVTDVRTGDVLAMVSLPNYDDNIFTDITQEQYQALNNDPAKPMVNHCISDTYPPGSTFKQITGTGALQEGVANAGTTITSYGSISVKNEYDPNIVYVFKDWAALGTLNFYQGVAQSSDVYFYYLAGGYYQDGVEQFHGMGATALSRYAREYGLGAPTGVDLPGEAAGVIPDPNWKEQELGETWTIGDTYNFAIGQGFVATTPLQMVGVTTAIANGGDVMVPRVVREVVDATGKTILPIAPKVARHLSISDDNLATFREGMRQAVSWGTANSASVSGVSVAGKTGTAEFGPDLGGGTYESHAWFTGFAPAEDPEIAVVVFLEQGNGAKNAAPLAGRILNYYFHRGASVRTEKVSYIRSFDYLMLLSALALVALGIILIYSGSLPKYGSPADVIEHPVARQVSFAIIGLIAMFVISRIDYRLLGYAAIFLYAGALASLTFVLVAGEAIYGSRRWIELAGTQVQPSELTKLILVIVLAKYLTDRQERIGKLAVFVTSLAIALVPAALVFSEPDLGSAVILLAIWMAVIIMAGARSAHVLGLIASAAIVAPFALIAVISDYQRERIATFLDPGKDPLGSGFNTLQAEISIGSGRLFGKGLTHGTQTQLDYLRTQTTDYIFSVLGEELGFVGVVILFALFVVLLMRGLQTAASSRDPFGRLLATGICTYILFQVFINVGVNIRLVPVTGIPLPFISQGGSSLVTLFIALGILQSVRTHRGPSEW